LHRNRARGVRRFGAPGAGPGSASSRAVLPLCGSGEGPMTAFRRVLVVSPHFPPDSSAASHRVRLLAPHLEEAGWSPTVVTLERSAYEGRLDPGLEGLRTSSPRAVRGSG